MIDLVLLFLLVLAFAAAAWFVGLCERLVRRDGAARSDAP
jgi:hypothetical protein